MNRLIFIVQVPVRSNNPKAVIQILIRYDGRAAKTLSAEDKRELNTSICAFSCEAGI